MAWTKFLYRYRVPATFAAISAIACAWVWAQPAATVALAPRAVFTVDTSRLGNEFKPGAIGLSLEAGELRTEHFNVSHYRLVRLMRLLGPSLLRIGGNSLDSSWWTSRGEPPPPWATSTVTPADLYALRMVLRATGWRVLLGVDLGHFEPARAAEEARYAWEILGTSLLGIEIGNEPNFYGDPMRNLRPPTYSLGDYLHEAEAYRLALSATAPDVAIYGPAFSGTKWLSQLGAAATMYTGLTQHYYPTADCANSPLPSTTIPGPTASGLLSPAARQSENETLEELAKVGAAAGRPTLIGETNDVACSGSPTASPVFASALWALDWSLRAASSGVAGLNFHGQLGPCGSNSESPICAASVEAARAGDVEAQPEYYGLLAARQLEGGRFVPTRLMAPDRLLNLTAWATLARDGTLRIAIDNLATTGPAQPVRISCPGYVFGIQERLIGPAVQAGSGITLGAAPVGDAGQWHPGAATQLDSGHSHSIVVQPASAVILTLHRARQHSRRAH